MPSLLPKAQFLFKRRSSGLAQQALYILRHLPSPLWLWSNKWLCEGHSSNTTGIRFLLASLDVDKGLSSICLSAITVIAFPSTVPSIPWLRTANSLARFACKSCLYVWQKLLQIGKCMLSKQNNYHQSRNPRCDWCLDRVDEGRERPVDSIQVWCWNPRKQSWNSLLLLTIIYNTSKEQYIYYILYILLIFIKYRYVCTYLVCIYIRIHGAYIHISSFKCILGISIDYANKRKKFLF